VQRAPRHDVLSYCRKHGSGLPIPNQNGSSEEVMMNAFSARTATATKRIVVIFATLFVGPVAASAQLNVLISGGFTGAYEELLPQFERTSGMRVTTGSGSSQGTGPQTIGAQLARAAC